jgi:hypothetical protein
MVPVRQRTSAMAIPIRPPRVRAAVGWRIPRVAEDLTRTRMVPMTARMPVQSTRIKPPREPVGAELQTPTLMVMVRQIVLMDVRIIAASRARTQAAAALELGAQERVVPDVGM